MSMMSLCKFAGRWGAVFGWLLLGLWLAGCGGSGGNSSFAQMPGYTGGTGGETVAAAADPRASTEAKWETIRPGDALLISFADSPVPVISPVEERVKEDGTIRLMENLTFTAAGKTHSQLEREIHDRYVPDYYKKMTVSVRPKTETQFYFVDGEVKASGRQIYISRTTVLRALASAGGFTDFARKTDVTLTRVDGRVLHVNCKKAQSDPRLDLEVYPGDKIWVPRRRF